MSSKLLSNPSILKTRQPNANQVLKEFLSHDPKARYNFSSERDSSESLLCRQDKGREECITIRMNSRQLFEAMQNHGFFCALNSDPEKTHMECKPMP